MQSIAKYSVIRSSIKNIRQICTSERLNEIFKISSMKEFDEKVKNSKTPVVIVDFYATWCDSCTQLTPRIEGIIDENGKITLAKVDIDELADLALDYDISSIPVLLAMRDGKVGERLVGLQDTDKLRTWVNNVIRK